MCDFEGAAQQAGQTHNTVRERYTFKVLVMLDISSLI